MENLAPSEKEVAQILEDEHLQLQRQFRGIEAERRHACLGIHPQHRRQLLLIKNLRDEYVNLERDLKIARSGAHKKKDEKMSRDLWRALLQNQESKISSDEGFRLVEEIDDLVLRHTREFLQLKKQEHSTKDRMIEERRLQSEFRLAAMENRLEVATRRFNFVYNENAKLRDQIEHMLKDRAIFNEAWIKMIAALGKGKRYMREIFDQSTMAYNQRDEWCSKLRSVQVKGKMDQVLQTQEMRELQKALDHDWELHRFLGSKGVSRVNEDLAHKREEEEEREVEEKQEMLLYHNKLLSDVQEYADNATIKEIVKKFKVTELHNNGIYRLVNEICAENEGLLRGVQKIRREIKNRRLFNETRRSHIAYNKRKLRTELDRVRERNQELRSKVDAHDQTLFKIESEVANFFGILGCSLEPVQELLGDKTPTLSHAELCLTLITTKVKEDISLVYYQERCAGKGVKQNYKEGHSRLKKFLITHETVRALSKVDIISTVRAEPCSVCMEARWLAKVPERHERPLSRDEAIMAAQEIAADLAYEPEDLMHSITECRLPRRRVTSE